jgi:hypothetical protein
MKLFIVFAQRKCSYEGQYAPEALHVVDEYSRDENPTWIEERLAEVEANDDFVSAAIIEVVLGDADYEEIQSRLTGITSVEGVLS